MEEQETPSKVDLRYLDDKVIFAISSCCLDKRYSFFTLSKEEAKRLVKRLQHFEKLTWKKLAGLDRKDGLTTEPKSGESFQMIDEQNFSDTKIVEQYYFHLRIERTGKFRIFGYQYEQIFYITHVDPQGKLQHS